MNVFKQASISIKTLIVVSLMLAIALPATMQTSANAVSSTKKLGAENGLVMRGCKNADGSKFQMWVRNRNNFFMTHVFMKDAFDATDKAGYSGAHIAYHLRGNTTAKSVFLNTSEWDQKQVTIRANVHENFNINDSYVMRTGAPENALDVASFPVCDDLTERKNTAYIGGMNAQVHRACRNESGSRFKIKIHNRGNVDYANVWMSDVGLFNDPHSNEVYLTDSHDQGTTLQTKMLRTSEWGDKRIVFSGTQMDDSRAFVSWGLSDMHETINVPALPVCD